MCMQAYMNACLFVALERIYLIDSQNINDSRNVMNLQSQRWAVGLEQIQPASLAWPAQQIWGQEMQEIKFLVLPPFILVIVIYSPVV